MQKWHKINKHAVEWWGKWKEKNKFQKNKNKNCKNRCKKLGESCQMHWGKKSKNAKKNAKHIFPPAVGQSWYQQQTGGCTPNAKEEVAAAPAGGAANSNAAGGNEAGRQKAGPGCGGQEQGGGRQNVPPAQYTRNPNKGLLPGQKRRWWNLKNFGIFEIQRTW